MNEAIYKLIKMIPSTMQYVMGGWGRCEDDRLMHGTLVSIYSKKQTQSGPVVGMQEEVNSGSVIFQQQVEYLRHMVRLGQVKIDMTNVISMDHDKIQTNKTQIRSFLDLCNLYRRFIWYITVILLRQGSELPSRHKEPYKVRQERR